MVKLIPRLVCVSDKDFVKCSVLRKMNSQSTLGFSEHKDQVHAAFLVKRNLGFNLIFYCQNFN